jgi:hypothetical protein
MKKCNKHISKYRNAQVDKKEQQVVFDEKMFLWKEKYLILKA